MSSVKSTAGDVLYLLPTNRAEAQEKVEAFLTDLVNEARQGVDGKELSAAQVKVAQFRVRGTEDRWKSLVHRLAHTDLGEVVAVERFRTAAVAALPKALTDAAFAAPRSPAQIRAEQEAEAAKQRAARKKEGGKRTNPKKAQDRPRKPKPAPTVTVKPVTKARDAA